MLMAHTKESAKIGKHVTSMLQKLQYATIFDYKANGNAWMTSNEFKAFINEFDAEMRIKKEKLH
jgi:hypothetical protein